MMGSAWRAFHIIVRAIGTAGRLALIGAALAGPSLAQSGQAITYPAVLRTRYEAVDPRAGGHFIIWLEREKVYHGLDPRLYPAVKYVDVTHVTPSPGSPIISLIEVMPVNASVPEVYHLTGIARFKVTGMKIISSTVPVP